jgi:hypothetical protein
VTLLEQALLQRPILLVKAPLDRDQVCAVRADQLVAILLADPPSLARQAERAAI